MASINVKFTQSFSFQLEGTFAVLGVARESSSDFTGAFSVDYSCIPISATVGVDFDPVSGTLNFSDNENLKYIEVPIYNDVDLDPMESFIVNISNLQAPGSTSSSITTSAHSVYIVDKVPEIPVTETTTETETIIPETPTETSTTTTTDTTTTTESQTIVYVTPTTTDTTTSTESHTTTRTGTLIPIVFPVSTPIPIDQPSHDCWCTPTGTICPARPRPSPTSTPTFLILPPDAPDYVIINGRCHKKTSTQLNAKNLNYNYAGNYTNCEDCNETLFQVSDPVSTPDASNAELDKDKIYQKYVLGSIFNERYWENLDQNSNLIYGNLFYNSEPVYGATALVYDQDGTFVTKSTSSSNAFNLSINHDPKKSYSITFVHQNFHHKFDKNISFTLPGQKFSLGDSNIKNV
jgi:hypothetical protein